MAKMIKKAQSGVESAMEAATAKRNTKGPEFRPGQVKRMTRVFEANPERGVRVAKRMLKRANAKVDNASGEMKKGGKIKKAEKGSSFGMLSVKAGVDNNPSATFADKIAGAKKKANYGASMMKLGGKAAKQAAIAIAMKKAGKAPKKMQYGGEAASMVPTMKKGGMKKKYKNGGTLAAPTKGGVSMQLGTYTRQIGKNYTGKNVVNKGAKAKMGKSVGKCKNGC